MNKTEEDIQSWFDDSKRDYANTDQADEQRIDAVLIRTRRSLAQKDTMDLAFVKIWTAMFELLAPLFASGLKKQSELDANRKQHLNKNVRTDESK